MCKSVEADHHYVLEQQDIEPLDCEIIKSEHVQKEPHSLHREHVEGEETPAPEISSREALSVYQNSTTENCESGNLALKTTPDGEF